MKRNYFLIGFLLLFYFFNSSMLIADTISISVEPLFQVMRVTEEWNVYTDENGIIEFEHPFEYHINVNSTKVYYENKVISSTLKRNNTKYTIITKEINEQVTVKIECDIYNLYNKTLVINDTCFYYPFDLINKKNKVKSNFVLVSVDIPTSWQLLEPSKIEYTIKKSRKHYSFIEKRIDTDILLFSTNTSIFSNYESENIKTTLLINREFFFIPSILKTHKNLDLMNKKVENYITFINNFFGGNDEKLTIQFLTVQIAFMALPVGDTIVVNEMYLQSLLTSEEGSGSTYHIVKALALYYLEKKYKGKPKERWLLEALSHYTASEYLRINSGKKIGEIDGPRIAEFFMGSKTAPYASTEGKFRELNKFNTLKPLYSYNDNPLLKYDYHLQAVYNHYSIQSMIFLEQLFGKDSVRQMLSKTIEDCEDLTFNGFFKFINNFNFNEKKKTALYKSFLTKYPDVDFSFTRRGSSLFLEIKGDTFTLPIELEYEHYNGDKVREVIFPDRPVYLITKNKDIKNIRIDPDNIIEERNESNNNIIMDFHFSMIAPPIVQNKYSIPINVAFCTFDYSNYIGLSMSGGWNLRTFNYNSLSRPYLFWTVEGGYSPPQLHKRNIDDFFFNTAFETSLYPGLLFAPQLYVSTFLNRDLIILKTGFQGFLPPVSNTEYDNLFFNQSYDVSLDFTIRYDGKTVFDISSGYKNFYKAWIFSVETLNGFSLSFLDFVPEKVNAGGTLHFKLNLNFIVFENITGILKTFALKDEIFEYNRPTINRGTTVIHTTGYFEKIIQKLSFPQGPGASFFIDTYDFIFNSFTVIFSVPLFKEPLMDPMISAGVGTTQDIYLSFYHNSYPAFKNDLFSIAFVMDIQKRISLSLRVPVFSTSFIHEDKYNYEPGFYFEIRSYL